MTQKNTGGPAFPELGNVGYNSDWQNESGMSLRDWFAGQALATIVTDKTINSNGNPAATVARLCYAFADAMIEARDK